MSTSDRDDLRTLPKYCPSWCASEHAQVMVECQMDVLEASTHVGYVAEASLEERRYADEDGENARVWREGGGRYMLAIRQEPSPTVQDGHNGPPLIDLELWGTGAGSHSRATAYMTTGEARVLAAQIVAGCDRVDLAHD